MTDKLDLNQHRMEQLRSKLISAVYRHLGPEKKPDRDFYARGLEALNALAHVAAILLTAGPEEMGEKTLGGKQLEFFLRAFGECVADSIGKPIEIGVVEPKAETIL